MLKPPGRHGLWVEELANAQSIVDSRLAGVLYACCFDRVLQVVPFRGELAWLALGMSQSFTSELRFANL